MSEAPHGGQQDREPGSQDVFPPVSSRTAKGTWGSLSPRHCEPLAGWGQAGPLADYLLSSAGPWPGRAVGSCAQLSGSMARLGLVAVLGPRRVRTGGVLRNMLRWKAFWKCSSWRGNIDGSHSVIWLTDILDSLRRTGKHHRGENMWELGFQEKKVSEPVWLSVRLCILVSSCFVSLATSSYFNTEL